MPFQSIFVAAGRNSPFAADLSRQLARVQQVRVEDRREDAQVTLEILGEGGEKHILSLSAAGKVREFELRYLITYRLVDQQRREWIGISNLLLRRNLTFDDRDLLAKESEESLLYRDMKSDALSMLLRILAKASPPPAS